MNQEDRKALPEVRPGVRCPTGSAVITGPNSYGKLNTPYVIHAVGPDFQKTGHEGDKLLTSAYMKSLECAKSAKLEAVAFNSLLSSGISVKGVLKIGLAAILKFSSYAELKEVHMCALTKEEANDLIELAGEMGLENTSND